MAHPLVRVHCLPGPCLQRAIEPRDELEATEGGALAAPRHHRLHAGRRGATPWTPPPPQQTLSGAGPERRAAKSAIEVGCRRPSSKFKIVGADRSRSLRPARPCAGMWRRRRHFGRRAHVCRRPAQAARGYRCECTAGSGAHHPAMSYCDVCGDLYRVEEATGAAAAKGVEGLVAVCTSCGKVETVTNGAPPPPPPPHRSAAPSS